MSAWEISPPRLALAAALATLLASGAAATWVHRQAAAELREQTEEKFAALMQVRRAALLEYLESVREEIRFWNKNRVMRGALKEFSAAFEELGPDAETELQRLYIHENPYPVGGKDNLEFASDGSEYSAVHGRYHYFLRTFLLHRGVYDMFLFNANGDLVYTSFKEDDYATNLVTGRYKDSDLGRAFREARDRSRRAASTTSCR
jgi:methyl-accepting chemotaxis protein